jgi:hypothetical protein
METTPEYNHANILAICSRVQASCKARNARLDAKEIDRIDHRYMLYINLCIIAHNQTSEATKLSQQVSKAYDRCQSAHARPNDHQRYQELLRVSAASRISLEYRVNRLRARWAREVARIEVVENVKDASAAKNVLLNILERS